MPRIAYEQWRPGADAAAMVATADEIATNYAAQGYDLTLRQLYYQFVANHGLPNTQRSYDRLGTVVSRARLAGLMDWNHLTDRTRNLAGNSHWDDPAQIIRASARGYALDRWEDQPIRVEVWVEKEALAGVVGRAAQRWDLDYFSCRGYVSQSEMWSAARRLRGYIEGGQQVVILHLGDHDPSGIDMTRDITDRLTNFIAGDLERVYETAGYDADADRYDVDDVWQRVREEHDWDVYAEPFVVRRIALNMDQVRRYNPPPNPAKITDSRAKDYMRLHGGQSWELDALDPATLDALISSHVERLVDQDRYDATVARQDSEREVLTACSARWGEVAAFLGEAS